MGLLGFFFFFVWVSMGKNINVVVNKFSKVINKKVGDCWVWLVEVVIMVLMFFEGMNMIKFWCNFVI